jgi:hypothetical protein
MSVTQLNPPLPLETPRGKGLAHFMIDYGPEHHLMWTVFITATGECWTFQNPEVRAGRNITLGRTAVTPIRANVQPAAAADVKSESIDPPSISASLNGNLSSGRSRPS